MESDHCLRLMSPPFYHWTTPAIDFKIPQVGKRQKSDGSSSLRNSRRNKNLHKGSFCLLYPVSTFWGTDHLLRGRDLTSVALRAPPVAARCPKATCSAVQIPTEVKQFTSSPAQLSKRKRPHRGAITFACCGGGICTHVFRLWAWRITVTLPRDIFLL